MKTFLLRVFSFLVLICAFQLAARAADTNPPPRLTVELRDGSRVIGDSVEKYFKFNSALLGEIKLDLKDIRSVECVSSNAAKLSTANGDSLSVSFVDSDFAVKTSFGRVELAVDSVHKFSVSAVGTGARDEHRHRVRGSTDCDRRLPDLDRRRAVRQHSFVARSPSTCTGNPLGPR